MENKTILDALLYMPSTSEKVKDNDKPKPTQLFTELIPTTIPENNKVLTPADLNFPAFEDVLDDECLLEQASIDTITNMLKPAHKIIDKIHKYIQENNIKNMATNTLSVGQAFTIGDNKYLLDDEKHLKNIYHILLSLDDPEVIDKSLAKRPNTIKPVQEYLYKHTHEFSHTLLKALDYNFIVRLVLRILTLQLNKDLIKKNDGSNITYLKSTLASILGHSIIEAYVLIKHIYIVDNTDVSDLHNNSTWIKEYRKRSLEEIDALILNLEQKIKQESDKCNQISYSFLKEYIMKQSTLLKKDNDNDSASIMDTKLDKEAYNIGVDVIDWLIAAGLFEEFLKPGKIPVIKYTKQQFISELQASSSHYKPHISTKEFPTVYATTRSAGAFRLEINLNKSTIPNVGNVHIAATEDLHEIIQASTNIPMSIDIENYNCLITLIEKLQVLSPLSKESIAIMNMLYTIDLNKLLNNNIDKELVIFKI